MPTATKTTLLVLTACLIIGQLTTPTTALKCYQCDSSKDEYCPETWDRTDIEPTDCSHIDYPAFCVKTTGIYGAIVGNRRFCSSRNMDNSCNEVNFAQDPRTYYSCIYTCTRDGCNSAVTVQKGATAYLSMLVTAVVYRILN